MLNALSLEPSNVAKPSPETAAASAPSLLNAVDSGIGVFDARCRLVACNDRFIEAFDFPHDLCRPGAPLADLLRLEAQGCRPGSWDVDQIVEHELALIEQAQNSATTRTRTDGRPIRIATRLLPDGGIVRTYSETVASAGGNGASFLEVAPGDDAFEIMEALEVMGDAFVYYDAEDRLVRWNHKYKEIYCAVSGFIEVGARFEDLLKAAVACNQIDLEDRTSDEYLQWRLAMRRQATAGFDIRLTSGRWLRVTERRTNRGGVVSVHTDITELKERENSLRALSDELARQNILFDAALNNMVQGLCMFDSDQRLIVVNRRYLEMYNFSAQIVKPGITLREIMEYSVALGNYTAEDGERALAERPSQAAKREQDVSLQRLRDGRVIAVMHSPLPNGGSVATYEDVTQREKSEMTLRDYAARLENSNRELQDFAFVASHDLQEPLRKIESFGNRLIARYADSIGDEGKMYIERMHNAAGRMRRLITDLLQYSRITTQAQPFEAVELEKIIDDVISDLQIAIEESGTEINVGPMPIIEADPTQMRQLFQNLLSNSLKFRKQDIAPQIRAQGRLFEQPGPTGEPIEMCEIEISDNGIGFDNKYAERIFAIFQRLHGKSEYEGTGIGLATCRKIMDRHNGTIAASGIVGEGASFLITLPTRQATPEQNK